MSRFELAGDTVEAGTVEPAMQDAIMPSRAGESSKRKSSVKALWAVGGFICFGLGVIGAVLPIIPTTPFLLAAAFFFARSSDRLNAWFKSTRLYKQVLEGYATKRTMTIRAKLSILVPVSIVLAIAFVLMANVPIGRAVLAVVWIGHIIYFGFIVKTDAAAVDTKDAA